MIDLLEPTSNLIESMTNFSESMLSGFLWISSTVIIITLILSCFSMINESRNNSPTNKPKDIKPRLPELNDIIVLGDNSIHRKYELFDINKTKKVNDLLKLDWGRQTSNVPPKIKSMDFGTLDEASKIKSYEDYYENLRQEFPNYDHTLRNDDEILESGGVELNCFIKFTIPHDYEPNDSEFEQKIIQESCLAPELTDEEITKLSNTIHEVMDYEAQLEEQKEIETLYHKYGQQQLESSGFESIKELKNKQQELENQIKQHTEDIQKYSNNIQNIANDAIKKEASL